MNGYGVDQNYNEAMLWLTKAADQNNHFAENWVGSLYYNGYGVPKRGFEEAFDWYLKSAV